jgi:2-succinyl-6-hydroxy-2,4-cyclohexadiene-1-carboxylate synthase
MLFYETFGRTSLENPYPLVFLHGFLGSRLDWMPIIEKLKSKYCCIALDLPAHGQSNPSIDLFKSVEKAILKLNMTPLLIGYSMGGRLAFSYGQEHPEKIKGLIAISAHTGLKTDLEKKKRIASDLIWQERLLTLSSEEFLSLWYRQNVFASLQNQPDLLKNLIKIRQYQNPRELADVLKQVSLANQPLYESFSHPTFLICGEEDVSYLKLYDSLPTPFKKVIKNVGHCAHLEDPLACVEAIESFASIKKDE